MMKDGECSNLFYAGHLNLTEMLVISGRHVIC